MKLRLNRVQIGLVAAAAVGGAAFFFMSTRAQKPEYETATVTRGDLEVTISEAGKIQPKFYVDVGAQVSGQLQKYYFQVGDDVKKGDLLAQIDPTLAQTKLDADLAQLDQLKASYAQEEASYNLAKANANRAGTLMKGEAIAVADYQSAIANLKVEQAKLDQWTAQIKRQQSTIDSDKVSLGYTKIYAPMSGTIVSETALEGQTLNANQITPTILRIADLSVMTVEAQVTEADVLRVKKGQDAYFTTLTGDRNWTTSVRLIQPQPETVNDVVLYNTLLDVDNADRALMPEMTAQIFFVEGRAKDAVLAPVAALKSRPQGERRGRGQGGDANAPQGPFAAQAQEPPAKGETPRRGRARNGATGPGGDAPNGDFAAARAGMQAVLKDHPNAERMFAMVMANGEPRLQPVLVGIKNRTQAEILWGLTPGDVLVIGVKQKANAAAAQNNVPRPGGFGGPGGGRRRGPG